MEGFHSTKEGFKEDTQSTGSSRNGRFHSTKEGFKVPSNSFVLTPRMEFPFHQGRFQGQGQRRQHDRGRDVSIPPRKVSRDCVLIFYSFRAISFHSTKEGFKGSISRACKGQGQSFHSTKEGFKGAIAEIEKEATAVSIPPRKVSRLERRKDAEGMRRSFHSTKEGFKARCPCSTPPFAISFHSTKEGFKVDSAPLRWLHG